MKVAKKGSLSDKEINLAIRLIGKHKNEFLNSFNQAMAGIKIKTLKLK